MKKATLHTDGGSRGNPGAAGIGYVLEIVGQEPITYGQYIGEATNNTAEYMALIKGLENAIKEGVETIECFLDSQLVVRQVQGIYRVKEPSLKPLVENVKTLAKQFKKISYDYIPREKNKKADALVNEALDKQARR